MSWDRIAGGYEINSKTGKTRKTKKYGDFGEDLKKLKCEMCSWKGYSTQLHKEKCPICGSKSVWESNWRKK